jgi:hypothetical protein
MASASIEASVNVIVIVLTVTTEQFLLQRSS